MIFIEQKRNSSEIKGMLYDYLTGNDFKLRVEAIVDSFRSMKDSLDKERRTTQRNWAEREKQIETIVHNVGGMYDDMRGIAGRTLPKIRRLELLPSPTDAG